MVNRVIDLSSTLPKYNQMSKSEGYNSSGIQFERETCKRSVMFELDNWFALIVGFYSVISHNLVEFLNRIGQKFFSPCCIYSDEVTF